MQVRRRVAVITATIALAVTALAAGPAAGATPLAGESMYWKVDKNGVKGLVAVNTPNGDDLTVAFQLWGLRPNTKYVLRGSPAACSAPAGAPVFERGFKTNGKGVYWDPVTVPAALAEIASLRLRQDGRSSPLLCINSSSGVTGGPNPNIATIKIAFTGGRGVAVIDETSTRRTVVSLTGLKPGVRHTLVIGTDGCGGGGTVLHRYRFTPDAKGRALVERIVFEPASVAGLGGEIIAGSIRVKRGSTTLDCATPFNLIV